MNLTKESFVSNVATGGNKMAPDYRRANDEPAQIYVLHDHFINRFSA